MKTVIFNAVSGFGNRLLPIVSIHAWCSQNNVQMGVIWNRFTNRSGLPRDEISTELTLVEYFDSIPSTIDVFSSRVDALAHYGIAEEQVSDYDMQWQPQFDRRYLDHDCLIVSKCCFLISLFSGNEDIVGQRADLSIENQQNYVSHPYIQIIKQVIKEFRFKKSTLEIVDNLYQPGTVGLQLRNTDGGFVVNTGEQVMRKMRGLIERFDKVYFSNDRPEDLEYVLQNYRNVVAYDNPEKFSNNDLGSLYSLVDLYALSRCEDIYVASRSSFGLIAHLYSKNSRIHYWI